MKYLPKAAELFYEARRKAEDGNARSCRELLIVAAETAANALKTYEIAGKDVKKVGDYIRFLIAICAEIRTGGLNNKAMRMLGVQSNNTTYSGVGDDWFVNVFALKKRAVGRIHCDSGSGTGFLISKEGLVLTNHHVVASSSGEKYGNLTIKIDNDNIDLCVLQSNAHADIALCKMKSRKSIGEIIELSKDKVMPGQTVMVIGNAFNIGLMPSTGIIRIENESTGNLLFSAETNSGDSGGPVLNKEGYCVGVNASRTLTRNGRTAYGFVNAVSVEKVKTLLKKWNVKI